MSAGETEPQPEGECGDQGGEDQNHRGEIPFERSAGDLVQETNSGGQEEPEWTGGSGRATVTGEVLPEVPGESRARILEIDVGVVEGKGDGVSSRGKRQRGSSQDHCQDHATGPHQDATHEQEFKRYTPHMHLMLFDIDGTLIRGKGMGRLAMQRAFKEVFGKNVDDYPEVRDVRIAGSTDLVILEDMARAFGISTETFRAAHIELEAAYLEHLKITLAESDQKVPCPGVPELLGRLEGHDRIELALLTGNMEPGARIKLEPFGLNRYFATGGFGNDHRDRRDMAIVARERAMKRTGREIPPEQVVVVGDTVHDVSAGKSNGFLTAAVATGWSPRETLEEAEPDRVFDDLTPENGFETWLAGVWKIALETDPV